MLAYDYYELESTLKEVAMFNFKILAFFCLEGLKKTTKTFSEYSRTSAQYSNMRPSGWEALDVMLLTSGTIFKPQYESHVTYVMQKTSKNVNVIHPEHTHAFFANSEFWIFLAEIIFKQQLLIRDYVSYLTYTTLISNFTNHVVLISSLSAIN
jgi:hypothetical protein